MHTTNLVILIARIPSTRDGLDKNDRHFAGDIFKLIFLNKNGYISIQFSVKFHSNGPINNEPGFLDIMALCQTGDMSSTETMTA